MTALTLTPSPQILLQHQIRHDHRTERTISTPKIKRIGTRYWKILVTQGVASPDARQLASAVVRYIYLNVRPSEYQERLIEHYSQQINYIDRQLLDRLSE